MKEQIRLKNVARLHVIFDILDQVPYMNIKKTTKHIANSDKYFKEELVIKLFEDNMSSQSKIEFSFFNFDNPEMGFQEVSINQIEVRGTQLEHLKYLMKDLMNRVMTDYVKITISQRNDTLNLRDYILKNIEFLVKEEIIC